MTNPPSASKPRASLRPVLATAALIAAGLLAGYWVGQLLGAASPERRTTGSLLGGLLGLPVVLGLTLLTHELGHVLGGCLVGFRFLLLIVGPLKVTRDARGLRFGLNRNAALAGGLAACLPTDPHHLNRRMLALVAGGPLASLALGAAGLWLHYLVAGTGPWDVLTMALGAGSLIIAAATLIPLTTAGYLTDGAQLLSLLRNDAAARQRALILALQAASIAGTRPRDWDAQLLSATLAVEGQPGFRGAAEIMAYYAALDGGAVETAGEHLARALALGPKLPKGFVEAVYLEAAYFEATHRQAAAVARAYLDRAGGSLAEGHSRLRAEAAVLWAEGEHRAARAAAAQAVRLAARSYDRGTAAAEAAWLERDFGPL